MRALDAAQIGGDATFERRIDRFAEIVAQQHIFRRDGGVGLELEQKMAVGVLPREQRLRRGIDMGIEVESLIARHRTVIAASWRIIGGIFGAVINGVLAARSSAARLPERIAPSMVAGKPVSVQSPASKRLRQRVCAPGRF